MRADLNILTGLCRHGVVSKRELAPTYVAHILPSELIYSQERVGKVGTGTSLANTRAYARSRTANQCSPNEITYVFPRQRAIPQYSTAIPEIHGYSGEYLDVLYLFSQHRLDSAIITVPSYVGLVVLSLFCKPGSKNNPTLTLIKNRKSIELSRLQHERYGPSSVFVLEQSVISVVWPRLF
jgi:hypothetical protein